MVCDADLEARLDEALRRLDLSMTFLEQRLSRRLALAEGHANSLVEADRARLASDLDVCRARERELEKVGAEASAALADAIEQLRLARAERRER